MAATHVRKPSAIPKQPVGIRESLDKAFKNPKFDLNIAFSFCKTFTDAPNPALNLEEIDGIGLPLSKRDAQAIKSMAVEAPFETGERTGTVVDTTLRGSWEMDSNLVEFWNPAWHDFLSRVVDEVCQTLGVNVQASQPRAELDKLLLHEPGSHFLPPVESKKADGMFATIVIVLPSPFTGGAAHLSHGGRSVVYDLSPTSELCTTVLAWYKDVQHKIKPITSGHCLALSYNLIHTTASLKPDMSAKVEVLDHFAKILKAWTSDDSGNAPKKIAYLLEHHADLNRAALKGTDALKVALLESLAQKCKFSLGLAAIECHLSGYADEYDRGYEDWEQCCYDEDSEEEKDLTFAEITEREMRIEYFVDMDGRHICEDLEFEVGETIPADLTENVEAGECYEQDYDRDTRNIDGGSLHRWYSRTVLVIWPNQHNCTVRYGDHDGFERACNVLETQYDTHHLHDKQLADFILSHHDKDGRRVAEIVCTAACAWDDLGLWKEAIKLCCTNNGVSILPDGYAVEALERFPWDDVQECFELMLERDEHNVSRLDFLKLLDNWALEALGAEAGAEAMEDGEAQSKSLEAEVANEDTLAMKVYNWVSAKNQEVLKSLRALDSSESEALLAVVGENGGIGFLKDIISPQLLLRSQPSVLIDFSYALYSSKSFSHAPEKFSVISAILKHAISNETFFRPKPPPPETWPEIRREMEAPPPPPQSNVAEKYITACFALGCPDCISDVINRVTDVSTLSVQDAQECAKDVMIPLMAYCAALVRTKPDVAPISKFEKLQHTGVKLFLDWISAHVYGLTEQEFDKVLSAVIVQGDSTLFLETVIPKLRSTKLSVPGLQVVVDGVRKHRSRIVFASQDASASLESALTAFAEQHAAQVALQNSRAIIDELNWYCEIERAELCYKVAARFLEPSIINKAYIENVLAPLLPELKKWAQRTGMLTSFSFVFPAVMLSWIEKVLGPHPNPDLAEHMKSLEQWTCGCDECKRAREYIQGDPQPTLSLPRISAPKREHIENHLAALDQGLVTYITILGPPRTLIIKKSTALHALASWKALQQKGIDILNSFSTDGDERRLLLGMYYDMIMDSINGSNAAPTASSALARSTISSLPALSHLSTLSSQSTTSGSPTMAASNTQAPDRPTKKRKMMPQKKS